MLLFENYMLCLWDEGISNKVIIVLVNGFRTKFFIVDGHHHEGKLRKASNIGKVPDIFVNLLFIVFGDQILLQTSLDNAT